MARNWHRLCPKSWTIEGNEVTVPLSRNRRHKVGIEEQEDTFRLTAIVAGRAAIAAVEDLAFRTWQRNRSTELVGFRIDKRGRLLGESWVPKEGLSEAEFQLYLHTIAAECDRYEYELTGEDM